MVFSLRHVACKSDAASPEDRGKIEILAKALSFNIIKDKVESLCFAHWVVFAALLRRWLALGTIRGCAGPSRERLRRTVEVRLCVRSDAGTIFTFVGKRHAACQENRASASCKF